MSTRSAKLEMVLDAIDRASGPIRNIERAVERLERATAGSSQSMTRYGAAGERALRSIATAATAAAAAGALVGKQIVSSAADFESSLTEIQKKAGTTAQATAAIGEEIKALSVSGRLAAPISEIAAAYERGAAAGLPVADLADFAELSVKGADAFGMSAEAVGNFSAKLRTGLGMSADEVREVLDLTNSLADAGIADESSIVGYMDRAGATLKTLGLAKEESLALGATMLNLGMAEEVAATGSSALAGKMLTVGTLSGKNRKVFEKYMGSVKGFAGAVEKDANAALLTMLDRLKGLDKADRMEFLQAFVGAEWSDEMLRLVEASDEYRRNLALAADEAKWMGSLDKSYELKLDDFWSQWQIAKNDLEILSIDLGTMAMPGVKLALEEARGLVQEIGRNIEGFPDLIDLESIAAARTALSELKTELEGVLGVQTTSSSIDDFFLTLSNVVNDTAKGIVTVKTTYDYLKDPTGLKAIEAARQARLDAMASHPGFGPSGGAADRALLGSKGNGVTLDGASGAGQAVAAAESALGAAGELRDKVLGDAAATDQGFQALQSSAIRLSNLFAWWAGLMPDKASAAIEKTMVPPAATIYEPMGDPMGTGSFTPPDIVGPLEAEGAEATQKAVEIGQKIQEATSVTAGPVIDTGSIDAATGKVRALDAAIRALSNASATGGSATSVAIDGARAAGGPVRGGGLYLVGEHGPELFSPGRSGMIHTAEATRRGLFRGIAANEATASAAPGGGGGSAPIDASFHHTGDIHYGSPQDKAEFEALLHRHARTVADVVAGEERKRARTGF